MATSGLLVETDDHAEQLLNFAEAMLEAASQVKTPFGTPVSIRVGVHSGRVMSGIVGTLRSRYCLFGGDCLLSCGIRYAFSAPIAPGSGPYGVKRSRNRDD
jgi:hypothetical protein